MSDNRLAGADFVRAFACLMVLAHHIAQRISPDVLSPEQASVAAFSQMGAFGVSAFFVLSGYLLARPFWVSLDKSEPMPSLHTYALRRAARILPGYWLALTMAFLASFTILGFTFSGELVLRYVAGVLGVFSFHWLTWFPVEFNGALWSIGCEIASYALLPVCLALVFALPFRGWASRLIWAVLILALIGLQFLIVRYLQPDAQMRGWQYGLVGGAKFWMPNFNPIGFFAVFAIGSLAAGIQVRFANRSSGWFDLVALIGLAVAIGAMVVHFPVAEGYGIGNIPYGFPWFPIGVAIILTGIPSGVALRRITDIAPIAYIARVSFGVYVWHFFLMEVIRVLWMPRYVYAGMTNVSAWAWISLAVVVISFFIATLSYALLEEPIMRWARGLEKRPTPNAPTLSPAAG
jgi:peptidoglycan/LPS O-acetylase OafA/YrhL